MHKIHELIFEYQCIKKSQQFWINWSVSLIDWFAIIVAFLMQIHNHIKNFMFNEYGKKNSKMNLDLFNKKKEEII